MSPALKSLLIDIRQHPAFRELIGAVERPRIKPFMKARAEQVEKARSEWIYESGQLAQHEAWLHLLSGTLPQDGEIPSQQED